jgi:hypothetical protein
MAFPNITKWIQEGLEQDGMAMVKVPVRAVDVDFDEVNAAIKMWLSMEGWIADIQYNIDDSEHISILVNGIRTDIEPCRHEESVEAENLLIEGKRYIQLRCAECRTIRGMRFKGDKR